MKERAAVSANVVLVSWSAKEARDVGIVSKGQDARVPAVGGKQVQKITSADERSTSLLASTALSFRRRRLRMELSFAFAGAVGGKSPGRLWAALDAVDENNAFDRGSGQYNGRGNKEQDPLDN